MHLQRERREAGAVSAIAGLWSFDGAIEVPSACASMLDALRIYGADDCARYARPPIAMGRCLLRLLPEDRFDRQPLSAQGVTAMVADVRVDNRPQLARELGLESAEDLADSSLLLAAWLRWGQDCLEHIDGAYAFAVWDEREPSLFLARDHTGERPLFYAFAERWFAFASMPKGLHSLPFIGAEIDEDYVAHYLTLANMPASRSIFRRMQSLPPGHALRVHRGEVKVRRHWSLPPPGSLTLPSDEDYLDAFRAVFDQAVHARLRTTGKIAAQLSGGLDSSSVAASAASILQRSGRELICFTARPDPAFQPAQSVTHFSNEAPYAAEVAALYPNIHHLCVESGELNFLDVLDRNNLLYDHPCFAPTNEVWSNAIMDRARSLGVTLLLNGNCGNSTLSYSGMPVFSAWFRAGQWRTLLRVARELKAAGGASLRSIVRHALWPSLPFPLRALTDPHLRGFSLDYSPLHPEIARRMGLQRKALRDLHSTPMIGRDMLGNLLEYGDIGETTIASQGGWKLDFRDPTFDRRVVEFCVAAPLEQFLLGGKQRSLVRRAMAGRLPEATLNRTARGRQSADWPLSLSRLRPRMLEEIGAFERSPLARRMLDLPRLRSLIENWPSSGFERADVNRSHHIALTRGISMGRFLRRYDPAAQ